MGGHAGASAGVVHSQSLGFGSAKMRLAYRPALNPVIEKGGAVQRWDASYAHNLSDVEVSIDNVVLGASAWNVP
jgi:hypothetical protein